MSTTPTHRTHRFAIATLAAGALLALTSTVVLAEPGLARPPDPVTRAEAVSAGSGPTEMPGHLPRDLTTRPGSGPTDPGDPAGPPEGCDFDGDGLPDLAIGVPGEDDGRGGVNLQYSEPFDFQKSGRLQPADMGYWGDDLTGFGSALACGDFDVDGDDDLAIGAPGTTSGSSRGRVSVLEGSADGLSFVGAFPKLGTFTADELYGGIGLGGDQFGATLEVADFDGDGTDDLAIGAPNDLGAGDTADLRTGSVTVVHGLAGVGFTTSTVNPQRLTGSYESDPNELDGARFGLSLAAAPFVDGKGDDLAVGAPGTDVDNHDHEHHCSTRWACGDDHWDTQDQAGVVYLFRTHGGLVPHERWTESDLIGPPMGSQDDEWFGFSLAAGNVDGDENVDLAIGTPAEVSFTEEERAGMVFVLQGTSVGPSTVGMEIRTQANVGENEETGDRFGWSLATGNLDGDGYDDLAVGSPGEDVNEVVDGGAVAVLYGTAGGPGNGVSWYQGALEIAGSDEVDFPYRYNYFGASVAFTRTALGPAVVIGVPGQFMDGSETYGDGDRAGQIDIVTEGPAGLMPDATYRMHQDVDDPFDVEGARELSSTMAPEQSLAWYGEDVDGPDPVIPTGEWFGWAVAQ